MKYELTFISLIWIATLCAQEKTVVYAPDWESLSKHRAAPQWFSDAKFGIYFHWGVYSVPAFGSEWYPRWMHFADRPEYKHHVETYGDPSKFGYHDFIPMFKAERFDPQEWADLFQKSGARFAGPVAEHHDGFSMWASKANPWNAKDMGPRRDIVGELEAAIRNRSMKFITTFHHDRHLQRYNGKPEEKLFHDSHYPLFPGLPPASSDPKLSILYGNISQPEWLETYWFGKLKEVIDGYSPDIIWFDSWLDRIPEEYLKKFCAYYLNRAAAEGKEVVIVRKQNDLPIAFTVNDLEKSRMNRLGERAWMTDETISKGSWCYTEGLQIKAAKDVLHVLIDIVSKNGVLLLNISPKADGTIPEDQRDVLLQVGAWLGRFGESIYETRPWYTYGEGPTKEPEGDFKNREQFLKLKYSAKDIRYTTKGSNVYAIVLGSPQSRQEMVLQSFVSPQFKDVIKNVSLLGSGENVSWRLSDEGLVLTVPESGGDEMAIAFRIELENVPPGK
jgi:alpha-L-fucosidase